MAHDYNGPGSAGAHARGEDREKKISDPETFARWLAGEVEGVWEDTEGDEPSAPPKVALTRQITGEKKWQVTIEWARGGTTRVVVD